MINFRAGITYVGNSSLEVGIKIISETPTTGERKHTCTAFLSFVHIDVRGKPKPVPTFTPQTVEEKKLWKQAEERKRTRIERVKRIKERENI